MVRRMKVNVTGASYAKLESALANPKLDASFEMIGNKLYMLIDRRTLELDALELESIGL